MDIFVYLAFIASIIRVVRIIEVVGSLSREIVDVKLGRHRLVKVRLFLCNPPSAGVAVPPRKVLCNIKLLRVFNVRARPVCIGNCRCDKVVRYVERIQANGNAVAVNRLHNGDGRDHIVERGRIVAVANMGGILILAVFDNRDCLIGADGLKESDSTLFERGLGRVCCLLGGVDGNSSSLNRGLG